MEILLHYIWKHRMFPLHPLTTNTGENVEIIDPGLYNRNAGPDFFNAKIKINGIIWVGNVEIHDKASDWYQHGHDKDSAYDNTILHVVGIDNTPVKTSQGETINQMQMEIPEYVKENYTKLLSEDRFQPCHSIVPRLSKLKLHGWMSVLQTERLEMKTIAITERVKKNNGSWEDAYFITLARNFGFGVNGEAFETWAETLSLQSVAHHRDDIFQIEAIFMGQAGLLEPTSVPQRHCAKAMSDEYFTKLRKEYQYLSHKFSLTTMPTNLWKFMRLRPQNFPNIRISQLANLYYSRKAGLADIISCDTLDMLREKFDTSVTPYWETHYSFGNESQKSEKRLSKNSVNIIIINTVIPVLFAYGRQHDDEKTMRSRIPLS